jgi:tetratricopeptide (TPR) repeat protein
LLNSWDYQFQKIWSQLAGSKDDFEYNMTQAIRLFLHMGVFQQLAITGTKLIVDELSLPSDKRRLLPIDEGSIYICSNTMFHLAWERGDSNYKVLGHEFRATDMLADALFLLSRKEHKFNFRVPLTCLVDYKGFRVLAHGCIPVDGELTLMHGPSSEGIFKAGVAQYRHLSFTAQVLNLKEHKFEWDVRISPAYVHLSAFTQLHKTLGYRELEDYVRETLGDDAVDTASVDDHVYILKLADLLPVDIDLEATQPDLSRRLRPEFLCDYEFPLSADAFINKSPESSQDDLEAVQAARSLRNVRLPELLELLDSMKLMPIDSKSLTGVFHSQGVNMRYLHYVAANTTLPHVKALVVVEMVARVAKRLLNQQMAEVALEFGRESPLNSQREAKTDSDFRPELLRRQKTLKKTLSIQLPNSSGREADLEQLSPRINVRIETAIRDSVVDFLNLVFGKGVETDYFWMHILLPKTSEHFHYLPERSDVNLNALLHAVTYHCSLQVNFFKEIQLGTTETPFDLLSLEQVKHKVKSLSLKNIEYNILANRYSEYRQQRNHTLTLQACNLRLRVSQALNTDPEFLGEPALLADIGEVLIETGDLDGSIKKAKEALVQVHPLSAESVKGWCVMMRALMAKDFVEEALQCFDNALTALDFHWGEGHPMHASVYSIMALMYLKKQNFDEALVLYKSSLMCCLKVLGPNHSLTAEVYMELGHYYSTVGLPADALSLVEKAFAVYESNEGRKSMAAASAALIIAQLTDHLGRRDQALQMVELCSEVYQLRLDATDLNDPTEQVRANSLKKQLIDALSIGVRVAARLSEHKLLFYYAEKAWELVANFQSQKSLEVATEILDSVTKAKIASMASQQKNLLVTALLNPALICEHEDIGLVEQFKQELLTPEFFSKTSTSYSRFLEDLLTQVCEAVRLTQKSSTATEALHYLCAILEVTEVDLRQAI